MKHTLEAFPVFQMKRKPGSEEKGTPLVVPTQEDAQAARKSGCSSVLDEIKIWNNPPQFVCSC
jgi:hypothetical protein